MTDETGVIVTYTETPERLVIFNVNGGLWNETSEDYTELEEGSRYGIKEDVITNNQYKPADPFWPEDPSGKKIFLGWTTNADIAALTDFSSTEPMTFGTGDNAVTVTPDAGGIVLDKIRSDYLWDFSQEPPYDEVLYAVWSDSVTVTFNIAYTQNINAATVYHHEWVGPDTESSQVPYAFCNTDAKGRYITYTMAKGDKVPKPEDPIAYDGIEGDWYFIKWLEKNSTTDSYRRKTVAQTDGNLATYGFDFTKCVTENVELVTSWTTAIPHIYTFTIENHVEGANSNEEFLYTIEVTDEWVYGKIAAGRTEGEPDQKWGSITTSLKNNQQYTVQATIKKITNWGGDYSVEIVVTDRDGIVVKDGHVIYCVNNTYKNFASDYKFALTIRQEEKTGFKTSVDVDNVDGVVEWIDPVKGYEVNEGSRSFTFRSEMSRSNYASFLPEINGYDEEHPDSSLTVIFTNKSETVPAPTGFRESSAPFLWMLLLGLFLCTTAFAILRRKAHARI